MRLSVLTDTIAGMQRGLVRVRLNVKDAQSRMLPLQPANVRLFNVPGSTVHRAAK